MDTIENRILRTTKTIKFPVNLVWMVWSNPEFIAKWWGPQGFTNTIQSMDFKEGGEWKFTMHGPDGKNYPNRSIYKEIIHLQKIVFEHFNPHFIATIIFEPKGDETFIDWSLLFDSVEMYEIVTTVHKAEEGQRENFHRLEEYLGGCRE